MVFKLQADQFQCRDGVCISLENRWNVNHGAPVIHFVLLFKEKILYKKVWRKAWLRGQRRRTSNILPQIKNSLLLPGNVDVLSIIVNQGKEDCSLVKLPDKVAKQFTWGNQHKRLRDGWRYPNGWNREVQRLLTNPSCLENQVAIFFPKKSCLKPCLKV